MSLDRRKFLAGSASILALSQLAFAKSSGFDCDVCIAGAGMGGVAAALAALHRGARVIMTEPTDWIGGQLTSQGVSAPDEHPNIEDFGCTRRYRQLRNAVRQFYRDHYPLTTKAKAEPQLNPGNGGVSKLCAEPRVWLAVMEAMLAPYLSSGQLVLLLNHAPESASMDRDKIRALTFRESGTGVLRTVSARYFLDATELGDVLPLTKTEFVTGTESHAETGELHAPAVGNPHGSQGFTFCFFMDYLEGEDHTISRPEDYEYWKNFVPKTTPPYPGHQIGWTIPVPTSSTKPWTQYLQPNPDAQHDTWGNVWYYRRVVDRRNFASSAFRSDITLVNWLQNDYAGGDLLLATVEEQQKQYHHAKQQSLSLLYWMQTEAERLDGGAGFKGLRIRTDLTGTGDGLAKHAYIREARRIKAEFTITEAHVGTDMLMAATGKAKNEVHATVFTDSVGIGAYKIDIHPSASGSNNIDISACPFQIPLGALLPVGTENLLAANKNIGTTHLTNACYREHVTEWGIGEAAGALAAHAVKTGKNPRQIRSQPKLLSDFQRSLLEDGFELEWPATVKALDW